MTTTFPHAYTIYGVDFDMASGTQVILNQIDGTPIELNPTVSGEPDSGNVYPNCLFTTDMRPTSPITTKNIKQALTTIGTEGLAITSDVDEFGLGIYAQKLTKYGKRAASGHRKWTISTGIIIPKTLTANRDGSTFSFDVIAIQDSASNPIAITNSATLPALPLTEHVYVLDKVVLGGVTLPATTDITLDFGLNIDIDKSGGLLFPNWVHIDTITPVLTVNGFDVDWIAALGTDIDITGRSATHANTTVWLKKMECGKSFYADAATQHIKLTMAGKVQPTRAMGGRTKATASMQVRGNNDGTNAPVVATLDVAIV